MNIENKTIKKPIMEPMMLRKTDWIKSKMSPILQNNNITLILSEIKDIS